MLHEKKLAKLRKIMEDVKDEKQRLFWEETMEVLLECVSEQDVKLMTAVLQQQWDFLQQQKDNMRSIDTSAHCDIPPIIIPVVRRIFDDFPIKHLVGVQPISKLVDTVYSMEYRYEKCPPIDNGLNNPQAKKMHLEILQNDVEVGARKFGAIWSPINNAELEHASGINIQAEKTQALSQEIRAEITNEVICDLKALAPEAEVVKLKGTETEQAHTLCCRIRSNCSSVAMTTRRGSGNWIVVSKEMALLLAKEGTANIEINDDYKSKNSEMLDVGTLSDTIRVFIADVKFDEILVGYKGTSETDTGYIYCPHTPLMTGGWVINAITYEPLLSFMTRYGKFVADNAKEYYRNIKVESDLLVKK